METTKKCTFCDNPLHLIRMGLRKIPLWVHRGHELDKCTVFKLDRNIMRDLHNVLENLRKIRPVEVKRNIKGEPVIFGEPRSSDT